jgi:hypothetical protein
MNMSGVFSANLTNWQFVDVFSQFFVDVWKQINEDAKRSTVVKVLFAIVPTIVLYLVLTGSVLDLLVIIAMPVVAFMLGRYIGMGCNYVSYRRTLMYEPHNQKYYEFKFYPKKDVPFSCFQERVDHLHDSGYFHPNVKQILSFFGKTGIYAIIPALMSCPDHESESGEIFVVGHSEPHLPIGGVGIIRQESTGEWNGDLLGVREAKPWREVLR